MDDDLVIEKVCRYVPVVQGTQGEDAKRTMRHMLLSLPRVKFLEGGETDFYHKYQLVEEHADDRDSHVVTVMSDKEREVMRLKDEGLSYGAIANRLNIARSTVGHHISTAKLKLAYQKGKQHE